jgi:hypothetical protein
MVARILYALAALAAIGAGAYFAWLKTDRVFVEYGLPLPFERFGAVTALAVAFFLAGFFATVYRLLFSTFNRRNPS